MKIESCYGYELHQPTSGGKAGKGNAKTSTIQVRRHSLVIKQFRYKVGNDGVPRRKAVCRLLIKLGPVVKATLEQ